MTPDPVTHAIDQQVNSKRIEEVDDCLTPTDQLLMSIAVSLKRIADAATGAEPQSALYGMATDLAWHMGQAFERGRGAA